MDNADQKLDELEADVDRYRGGEPIEYVTLRTGKRCPRVVVEVIELELREWHKSGSGRRALKEIAALARHPNPQPSSDLIGMGLADPETGVLRPAVADAIVALTDVEGSQVQLVDPVSGPGARS